MAGPLFMNILTTSCFIHLSQMLLGCMFFCADLIMSDHQVEIYARWCHKVCRNKAEAVYIFC